MKACNYLAFFALAAWGGGILASCSNDVDELSSNQPVVESIEMARTPDVYAWSGSQKLNSTLNGRLTAKKLNGSYKDAYIDWCATWWPENVPTTSPEIPSGAITLTQNNFMKTPLMAGGVYVLDGNIENDYTGLVLGDIPEGVTLYIKGGHWNLFDQTVGKNITIYVCEDADLLITEYDEEQVLLQDVTLYNYGNTKIHVKANTIGKGCLIYDAGYLEIEENEQYEGSNGENGDWKCVIEQPIYSMGEVYFKGDVTLGANSYFRQVCVDGDLTVTKGTTIKCGYLNADQINCEEEAKVVMAPEGLMVVGTYNMDKGSMVSTEAGATKLGSILTNDILGDRKEDTTGRKDYGYKYLNNGNFGDIFKRANIFVTKTINNSQDKATIESHVPGESGKTIALMYDEEFDASDETDVNSIICGGGYDWLPKVSEEPVGPGETVDPEEPTVPGDDGDDVDQPKTPTVTVGHENEVEVNLSIVDSHDGYVSDDLAAKLSIHVRKGTDVRIVIPVPAEYVCASDDLVILEKHKTGLTTLPKDQVDHTTTYTINDEKGNSWTVTLTVTLNIDSNEIIVETNGIDQALIDYLYEKNGDGINFEVWTYFTTEDVIDGKVVPRDNVSREELRGYLNKSTIEFLDEEPDYYINAFYANRQSDTSADAKDCTVSIVEGQSDDYDYHYEGAHLNGADYNQIYVRDGVEANDSHSAK